MASKSRAKLTKAPQADPRMMSSKGKFVVKLPKERVDDLVAAGQGEYFDTGRGRLMKEWVAMPEENAPWIELAREALLFVKGHQP